MTTCRLCVIPARGGSKRIPRKNILDFGGKPMITWSIEAALASGLFDRVWVSTDDEEIASIARRHGAEVPFMRPAELANDQAGTNEVMAHACQWAAAQGWIYQAVCCIYATAPFIEVGDLQQGLAALESGPWSYAFSVTDFGYPIFRALQIVPSGGLGMFFPENYEKRSQDLPTAYHDAGQFYWGRPQAWATLARVFDSNATPVVIPRWRVQDIDTPEDWRRAELMHWALRGGRTQLAHHPGPQGAA